MGSRPAAFCLQQAQPEHPVVRGDPHTSSRPFFFFFFFFPPCPARQGSEERVGLPGPAGKIPEPRPTRAFLPQTNRDGCKWAAVTCPILKYTVVRTMAALPAVVLVTRRSTYDADADACLATWLDASRPSLARMKDTETAELAGVIVRSQVEDVMPLMFTLPIVEPTLAEVELKFWHATIRIIVQLLPERASPLGPPPARDP